MAARSADFLAKTATPYKFSWSSQIHCLRTCLSIKNSSLILLLSCVLGLLRLTPLPGRCILWALKTLDFHRMMHHCSVGLSILLRLCRKMFLTLDGSWFTYRSDDTGNQIETEATSWWSGIDTQVRMESTPGTLTE